MSITSTIPNRSRACEGDGTEPHRRRQASILPSSGVLLLLYVALAPVTTYVAASTERSNGWSEPQSGWLYVLDPDVGDGKSVVWLVDPGEGVKGALEAGYAPFFALSPDGARLYVVSGQPGPPGSDVYSDELWAIDTASAVLLQRVKLSDRVTYTLPAPGGLAVSPDGRYVHVAKSRTIRPGVHEQTIQTYDTIRKRFLPEEAKLPGCGFPEIIPVSGTWQLVVDVRLQGSPLHQSVSRWFCKAISVCGSSDQLIRGYVGQKGIEETRGADLSFRGCSETRADHEQRRDI